jgi:hypothetical protein
MRAIVVVSVDLLLPEDAAVVVAAMDPLSIPHFAGEVRVVVGDDAQRVIDWLDEEE